jgi:hypothetical protein
MRDPAIVGLGHGVADVEEPPEQLLERQAPGAGVAFETCVGVEGLDRVLEAVASKVLRDYHAIGPHEVGPG